LLKSILLTPGNKKNYNCKYFFMKKEMRRIFTILILGVCFTLEVSAQDPEFTQFYANPLYTNPAFAGTQAGARFCANFRDQWPSISGTFVTYAASYDQHFDGIGGGIGAQVWNDRAGDGRLTTTAVSGMYSYDLHIKDASHGDYFIMKAGLQAGAFQRSIDFSKLVFGDQIDPRLGPVNQTQEKLPSRGVVTTDFIPDFSAGLLGFTKRYYAGFAVNHIVEPSESFFGNPNSILPRKYTFNAGMTIPIDNWKREPTTFVSPNILFQQQAKFRQVNFGAYLIKNYFIAGLWYRQTRPNSDAMMVLVGVKKDAIKIAYSYDLTVSDARAAATGSHEVSLVVELQPVSPKHIKKWRKISCPDF
jgi:type IX secretion system PorP/SprF family membrane protein